MKKYIMKKGIYENMVDKFKKKWFMFIQKLKYKILYIKIVYGWYDKEPYFNEIKYLKKKKRIQVFPYSFADEYNYKVEVRDDNENGYVMLGGDKKLFFPGKYRPWISKKYVGLCREQDARSAHCYFSEKFHPSATDIFIDVGAAEGKEALEIVDLVRHIYLFEAEDAWGDVLKKSFDKYEHVDLIRKFVGDQNGERLCTLDSFFSDLVEDSIFLKMDVEGNEMKVLEGAQNLLMKNHVCIVVTTYHNSEDFNRIWDWLVNRGFNCEHSEGYMLFLDSKKLEPPYFRRGVIRARNY